MALNSYFLQGSSNEQFLIQDLVNEQLKIYGIDVSSGAVKDLVLWRVVVIETVFGAA